MQDDADEYSVIQFKWKYSSQVKMNFSLGLKQVVIYAYPDDFQDTLLSISIYARYPVPMHVLLTIPQKNQRVA